MKTIGLLGGMSWESTIPYYQSANRVVRDRLGGLHSAKLLLYSVDFHEVEACQSGGRWTEAGAAADAGALARPRDPGLPRIDSAMGPLDRRDLRLYTQCISMEALCRRESRNGATVWG